MNTLEIKNKFDQLLKQLSTERSFDVAEKITTELVGLLNIKTTDRFLVNIPRVDAELTRFQLAPGFARQAAAYELPHEDDKPIDFKLFWVKKASKTNLSWLIGLTPNFEDALSNDYKNIGIDFVVSESCDSIIVLLSNKFKIRALELKDHITPTQLEILNQWVKLSELEIVDKNEFKSTLHLKLWESFNFEPINRKFYLELVEHFSVLVHHLEKDLGRKPSVMFTTRLIGRLLFIWFLKKKNLINDKIDYFTISDTEKQKEYYENKLEKLFFEVLNREELERDNGDKLTPYLNGGLFDKNTTDFFNDPKLTFPNGYFNQLFTTLNKYNFTVDESSPEFQHVAIDPEMLGRIFESLLAEQIDENTGNSKKKATGAFYTPREIVSYMCEQSLIEYLKTKVPEAPDRDRRIEELVRMPEAIFRDQDQNKRRDWKPYREAIIKALEGSKTESPLTVLDPAVGSGAFPMGMLHLLVKVYSRLDPKFEKDISGLKRNILSRSLYGVDIEQTAIEITRLRAWLSIIVDIPEGEKVDPLPNLEFKFVCANTLIPLDSSEQATFFTDHDLKDKLITIRDEYFKTSSKIKKEKLQKDYLKLTQNASLFDNKKTQQLKSYKPFDISSSSEFYDPELMHGVQVFDVVIGNPPYVQIQKFSGQQAQKNLENIKYDTFVKTGDLYCLFFERGVNLLINHGVLVYITSNSWLRTKYGHALRNFFIEKTNPIQLVDFSDLQVFDSAVVASSIMVLKKEKFINKLKASNIDNDFTRDSDFLNYLNKKNVILTTLSSDGWTIGSKEVLELKQKIEQKGVVLKNWDIKINYGIKTGLDKVFIINENTKKELIEKDHKSAEIIKPILRGRNINKYGCDFNDIYIILTGFDLNILEKYPAVYSYLLKFKDKLENRSDKGKYWWNLRSCAYYGEFENEKISWIELADIGRFTLVESGVYTLAGTFILSGRHLKFLLAFLNSKIANWYFNQISTNSGVGTNMWKKYKIEQLPVPSVIDSDINPVETFVDQILTLKKQNKDADTKNLESQIDQLVYKLYGLTEEEIKIVEESVKR